MGLTLMPIRSEGETHSSQASFAVLLLASRFVIVALHRCHFFGSDDDVPNAFTLTSSRIFTLTQ